MVQSPAVLIRPQWLELLMKYSMTLTMPRAQNDHSPSPKTCAHPSIVAYTCICASCQIVAHFWSIVSTVYLILIITLYEVKVFCVVRNLCMCVCNVYVHQQFNICHITSWKKCDGAYWYILGDKLTVRYVFNNLKFVLPTVCNNVCYNLCILH